MRSHPSRGRAASRNAAVVRFTVACALLALPHAADAQVPGLAGTLIVTNKGQATATIIDVATGRTLATLPTGQGPHEIVLSADGRTAVVTDYGARDDGSSLTVIDVPGLRVVRTIDLGRYTRPHGIAFLPGDSLVAVTSETTRNVVLVNVAAGAVRRAISTERDGSHMVAVSADGSRLWTGDIGSNTISELDANTGRRLRSLDVPAQPEAINVLPDGSEVWVGSNATGVVSVVDARSGRVATAAEGLGWPYRILFSPDATLAFLPDLRGETLRVLDRASRKELARLAFAGGGPQGITITPDGRWLLQSLSRQGRVAVIDVATRTVVGYITTGQTPDGVAYTRNLTTPAR
jgi:YVTN family beta-propeller protein